MKKRNTAIDLTDLAIGILILGIVVAIGANILISVRDSRLTDLPIISVANETNDTVFTDIAGSEWQLDNVWGIGVTSCGNATIGDGGDAAIGTGNYSVVISDTGVVRIVNLTSEYSSDNINCTYTHYDTTQEDWALPNSAAIGLAEYGNWFDIIVIVGVAALILSLIFLAFGNRGQEQGGVSY